MATVKLGLKGLTPTETAVYGSELIEGLDGNADFPSPSPTVLVLQTKVDELVQAIVASSTHDSLKIQNRNTKMEELQELIRLEAQYVQFTSQGDAEKILSTGFDVVERGGSIPSPLPATQGFKVSTMEGFTGQLKLSFKKVHGAGSYCILQSTDTTIPQLNWETIGTSNKLSYIVTGLTPGAVYSYKVVPIGSDNVPGAASVVISAMAI